MAGSEILALSFMRHYGDFLEYIKNIKHYSPYTVTGYQKDLDQFFSFCGSDCNGIEAINHKQVRLWIISLMENGYTARTVNRKISALRSFCKFLLNEGVITSNPMNKVLKPKSGKNLPSFVDERHLNHLLDEIDFGEDYTGTRNKLIIETFYNTGIRLSELIQLKTDDVYVDGPSIKVLGKRNKERLIPITREFYRQIQNYINVRNEQVSVRAGDELFLTAKGRKLYPRLVYRVVNRYLALVTTIEKKSPHVLRHSFATHILNKGADLNSIKELLGHANLAATEIYTHNTFEKLKSIYKQAHPRA